MRLLDPILGVVDLTIWASPYLLAALVGFGLSEPEWLFFAGSILVARAIAEKRV